MQEKQKRYFIVPSDMSDRGRAVPKEPEKPSFTELPSDMSEKGRREQILIGTIVFNNRVQKQQ